MAVYEVKQGDTEPMEITLRDRKGIADLTGATSIVFGMKAREGTAAITRDAEVLGDPKVGKVQVPWGTTDLAIAGLYDAEVQVIQANGKKQTFPSGGDVPYLVVDVKPQIVTS